MSLWAPPPDLKVSEWADRYRMLSPESSAEPGQWDTDRAPYQRGMMDVVNEPGIRRVDYITGTQIGKNEVQNNIIGYFIHQDPSPILYVHPTKELAVDVSKDRIAPMIRDTAVLRELVADVASRDSSNTLLHKAFPGGNLTLTGANSPAGLAGRPKRILISDEVDRFTASAGTEGNPRKLARKRIANWWNSLDLGFSAPTLEEISEIYNKGWKLSDQRRYWMPCAHCEVSHLFEWKHVLIEDPETGVFLQPKEVKKPPPNIKAFHFCPHCGAAQTDGDKIRMLAKGEWRKSRPEVVGHAGFHLSALYSPWLSFAEIVAEFFECRDDPLDYQIFINTTLAWVWRTTKTSASIEGLLKRREGYTIELVPAGAVVLIVTVDVQDDRLEWTLVGWGAGKESWVLDHVIASGGSQWKALNTYLKKTFPHESGRRIRILGCGVDTGHRTKEVYDFCMGKLGRNVFALKGAPPGSPLSAPPVVQKKTGLRLYHVGVNEAKDWVYRNLVGKKEHGPGYIHFGADRHEDYFDQFLSEHPVVEVVNGKKRRRWVLKPKKKRNETWDTMVYNRCVLEITGIDVDQVAAEALAGTGRGGGAQRRGRVISPGVTG